MNYKKHLKAKIGNGDIKPVIDELLTNFDESDPNFNSILVNSFRLNKLLNQNILGVISFDEYNREHARVVNAICEIIDILPEKKVSKSDTYNINYQEAIDFVFGKSPELNSGYIYSEKTEQKEYRFEYKFDYIRIDCSENGQFKITYTKRETYYNFTEDLVLSNNENYIAIGKMKDLVKTTLSNAENLTTMLGSILNINGLSELNFTTYNGKHLIEVERETTRIKSGRGSNNDKKEIDKWKSSTNKFSIMVENRHELSLRIVNAINLLIYHFGGRDEAF